MVTGPRWERLVAIMAALADGDHAAAIALYHEFGGPIRAMVARRARRVGAYHLTPDDIEGMAVQFCLDLIGRADAWDPGGGALPWVWARKLLHDVVDREIGRYCAPLEGHPDPEDPGPVNAAPDDRPLDEVLADLARRNAVCRLLLRALAIAAAPRDAEMFLNYAVCQRAGDPSPSHTVGSAFGLTPVAVRKAVERVRRRLRDLADDDPVFAPLRGLPILAPRRLAA